MSFPASISGVRAGVFRVVAALGLLLAAEPAAAAAPPGGARQLVRELDADLAGAAQAAGTSDPRLAAFHTAVARLRLRLSRIDDALARRDEELFLLLDEGSSDLGWLRVAWARSGVSNDRVTAGLRAATASYRFLRAHYGREGLRLRRGGPLSDAERRQLQRVQRRQRRFAESLRPLRERARRRGDPTTVAELDRFRDEAEAIARASLDLEAYLQALIAAGEVRGEWEADAPYVRQGAAETFAAADQAVQDLYVDSDIGHVFTVDFAAAGGWSFLDGEAQTPPGEASAALQVYEPAAAEEDEEDEDGEEAGAGEELAEAEEPAAPEPETAEMTMEEDDGGEPAEPAEPAEEAAAGAPADPQAPEAAGEPAAAAPQPPAEAPAPAGPDAVKPPAEPAASPPPIG